VITAEPRIRVAAYVIRPRPRPELLVFEHLDDADAGLQVPAGGVDSLEDLSQAVLREVHEETGLSAVTVVRALTTEDKPHPETGQPRRTTFFHLQVPINVDDDWTHQVTGAGGDGGMVFACRFEPLPLPHPLADNQDTWLSLIDPAMATQHPHPQQPPT